MWNEQRPGSTQEVGDGGEHGLVHRAESHKIAIYLVNDLASSILYRPSMAGKSAQEEWTKAQA